MSRPRSRSPRNGFPWEEPTFDPCQVVAELDGNPKEPRRYFREDLQPEGHRRDTFPSDRQLGHQRRPDDEGFYHRNVSPRDDVTGYDARRLSPHGNIGRDGDRRREGFREHFQSLGNRGRLPHSPPSLLRERFPQPPRSRSDHLQREPGIGWREEQGRGHGRFREPSPGIRSGDQRGGAGRERGRRNEQGPNRDRRRDELHPERSTPYKRQRRDMDEAAHPGFMRNEEDYGQRYSVDTPRDRCGGDFRGSSTQGETRPLRPVVIEHDHGIRDQESRNPPQWDQFDGGRHLDFKRQRSPRPQIATQERFRTPESQFNDGKNGRRSQFQDNRRDSDYIEPGRNPTPQNRPNIMRSGDQRGPMSLRGRGGPHPVRGRLNHVQTGRTEPFSGQPRLQQSSQGYQDRPREEQRPGFQPFREDSFNDLSEGKPKWTGEDRLQQWDHDRSMDRNLLREDLDPKMPRQREHGWNVRKSNETSGINEETLTIKVDMTRPADQNSSLCYSSDRQLSLDLVNVGRQRLDFLPMLEHSGTYRETAMHTGTFAQEIITLVHHVKEQYFRDEGVTLNERFSAPQQSGYSVDEVTELTLDERFSSNRDFSLDMDSLYNDDPLFATVGSLQGLNQQPVRGPGDLRHDLERRRQERLEAVKVTIPGGFMSQRPVAPASDLGLEESYETSQVDDDRFSTWQEEQTRRREGNMVPRRGAPYRQNTGALRRNNRFGPRGGPMRRQPNYSNNPAGPIW